jgi:hypothetical protein
MNAKTDAPTFPQVGARITDLGSGNKPTFNHTLNIAPCTRRPPGATNHLLGIGHVASSSPIGITLARSLKRAIVFAGAEGCVPRDHARWLISILGLEHV